MFAFGTGVFDGGIGVFDGAGSVSVAFIIGCEVASGCVAPTPSLATCVICASKVWAATVYKMAEFSVGVGSSRHITCQP